MCHNAGGSTYSTGIIVDDVTPGAMHTFANNNWSKCAFESAVMSIIGTFATVSNPSTSLFSLIPLLIPPR